MSDSQEYRLQREIKTHLPLHEQLINRIMECFAIHALQMSLMAVIFTYMMSFNVCKPYLPCKLYCIPIALDLFISTFSRNVCSRRLSESSRDECHLVLSILDGISE